MIIKVNPVRLDPASGIRREPSRPPDLRIDNFEAKYDHTTLFFDCLRTEAPNQALLLGPPFLNLAQKLKTLSIEAHPTAERLEYHLREMDRHQQVWISAPSTTESLVLKSGLGEFQVSLQPNLKHMFAGRRVLFTLSKNNRLEWVSDWIRFNRDIHGADGVLIYDNSSTEYTTEKLAETVAAIPGIAATCIVDWPFLWGPPGIPGTTSWDSDYAQRGAWEHARWMFLPDARSAMNSDVDELVLDDNLHSVFAATEQSPGGCLRYYGHWVPGLKGLNEARPGATPRYRDFCHFLRPVRDPQSNISPIYLHRCSCKWTVVPRRCPPRAQWSVHKIDHWPAAREVSSRFVYRHFRLICDHWRNDRSKLKSYDEAKHEYDKTLVEAFSRVRWND